LRDPPIPVLAVMDLRHARRVLPGHSVGGRLHALVADSVGPVPVHVGRGEVV